MTDDEAARQLVETYKDWLLDLARWNEPTGHLRPQLEGRLKTLGFSESKVTRYADVLTGLEKQLDAIRTKRLDLWLDGKDGT